MVTVRSYQQAFYLEKTQKLTASAALRRANGCAPTLSLGSSARLRAPGAVGDGSTGLKYQLPLPLLFRPVAELGWARPDWANMAGPEDAEFGKAHQNGLD